MAMVSNDGNLVIVALAQRSDTVLLSADDTVTMAEALEKASIYADAFVAETLKAGKLVVPQNRVVHPYEAKVGLFDQGVALKFSEHSDRFPLPPAIARELARRLRIAAREYQTGISFRLVSAPVV